MSDLAVLVVSRNRPDLVQDTVDNLAASIRRPYDLHVVECGTDADKVSPRSTLWVKDADDRGEVFAYNLALQAARLEKRYDYYWVVMSDTRLDPGQQPAETLISAMAAAPQMAILSPTASGGRGGGGWRPVATGDHRCFMMRGDAVEAVGFLNPDLRDGAGAMVELSHRLHTAGWFAACTDAVSFRSLGGAARAEDTQRAARLALAYMVEHYGWRWAECFWEAATAGHAIETDTFERSRQAWTQAFSRPELEALAARAGASLAAPPPAEGWSVEGQATLNILLWPDYRNPDDFAVINEMIAPRFAGLDASLLLRVDPLVDGSLEQAKQAVAEHGPCPAKIGWVTGTVPDAERAVLGEQVDGIFALPSSADEARADFLANLRVSLLALLPQESVARAG